jgi:alanine-glyoxylate transaminase/serine-glyoxylate transaminase/serine-pyruvate transaminase
MNMKSFHPPMRVLMGPGPSDVHPRVLEALSRPTLGHLDPKFIEMMDEVKALLQYAFQTKNELTMAVSGPGTSGMETCISNLVEPGDKILICQNGYFGGRMKEMADRYHGHVVHLEFPWGTAIDPNKLEDALKANRDAKVVAFVHAETSTGALSDAKTLTEIIHKYNALAVVDAVTSLAGVPLKVDEWGIDAIFAASQKCLRCTPGLSPISFNARAVEAIKKRKTKVGSWFLDLSMIMAYWGGGVKRSYHHTAPINALYGLHEALVILQEEGLENSWERHRKHHQAIEAGLEAMGLKYVVKKEDRLPQLNAVAVPEGIDEAKVRSALLHQFGLEIGAGLGMFAGKVLRIGIMGYSCNMKNILMCLSALESVLGEMKAPIKKGVAVNAAYAEFHKN